MIITADGDHKLKTKGGISAVYVSGSAGGGTITLGTKSGDTFTAYKDADGADTIAAVGEQYEIRHGLGVDICVKLVTSSNASLTVSANGI